MNKKSKTIIIILSITISILTLGGAAMASKQNHKGFCGDSAGMHEMSQGFASPMMSGYGLRMIRKLDLSKAQRDQVWLIIDDQRKSFRNSIDVIVDGRKQLRNSMNEDFNEVEIRQLADKQGQAMADLIVMKTKLRSEIYAVLTPAQKQQSAQIRTQHKNN